MVESQYKADLRRRSGAFGSGLVQIRDGRDELVDLLVPLTVWRGGLAALLPGSSDAHTGSGRCARVPTVAVLLRMVAGYGRPCVGL